MIFVEHLGLIRPQMCQSEQEPVTPFMRPAPFQNDDESGEQEDALVADPLADETEHLLNNTAKNNRNIFTEVFRCVPTNLVRDWKAYDVRIGLYALVQPIDLVGLTTRALVELPSEGEDGTRRPGHSLGQGEAASV